MVVEFKVIGWREDKNKTAILVTPWSMVHFLSGMAAKQTKLFTPFWWFATHAVYEAKDQVATEQDIIYNSFLSSIGYQAAAMLGFYVADYSAQVPLLWVWAGSLAFAYIMEDSSLGPWIG